MRSLKQFDGIESDCPECGQPTEAWWVSCPACGVCLAGEKKSTPQSLFICPGCGERATANGGRLCRNCSAFVHNECVHIVEPSKLICPICRTEFLEGARARS